MPSFCGELDGGEPHAGAEPPTAATALPAAGRWGEGMNHHEWDFHRYGTRKRPSGSPARRWVVQQSLPRLLCDTAARAPSLPAPAAAWLVLLSGQPRPHRVRCGRSGGRARGRGCRPAESPAGPAAGGARPSPAPGAAPSGRRRLPAGGDKHPRRHRPGTPPPPPPVRRRPWGVGCPLPQPAAPGHRKPPPPRLAHPAQAPASVPRGSPEPPLPGAELRRGDLGDRGWGEVVVGSSAVSSPSPLSGEGAAGSGGHRRPPARSAGGAGGRWRPRETPPPRPPAAEGRDGGGRKGRGRREGESREAEQEGAARESGGERGSTSASGGGRAAPAARGCALGRGGGDGRARGGSASRRPPRLGRLPPRYIGEGGVAEGGVPGVAKAHGAAMPPARGAHK